MDREELQRRYNELRRQGLTHEQALARLNIASPTAQPEPPAPARRERPEEPSRGGLEEFARGAGLGATEAATGLAAGIGWLGRKATEAIPGESFVERGFGGLERNAERVRAGAEELFDPRGGAGTAGRLAGRIAGEIGTTLATAGIGRAGAARYAPKALEAARGAIGTSRAGRAAAIAAPDVALSLPRAAGRAAEGGDLGTELALELGGSALGGLLGSGAIRPAGAAAGVAEEAAESAIEQVPIAVGRRATRETGPRSTGFMGVKDLFATRLIQEQRPALALVEQQAAGAARSAGMTEKQAVQAGRAARKRADSILAQVQASSREALLWTEDQLTPFFTRPGEAVGGILDSLLGRTKVATPDEAFGDIRDKVAKFALVRREFLNRQRGRAAKLDIDDEALEAAFREGMADERLVAATDKLQGIFRALLSMREEAGIITKETADAVRASDDYYTPFLAEYYAGAPRGGKPRSGPLTVGSFGIDKMNRKLASDALRVDPFEVAVTEAQRTFRDVGRQRFQNYFQEFVPKKGIPGLIKRLPIGRARQEGAQVYPAISDGVMRQYEVLDKDLYNAIANNSELSNNIFARFARGIANVKRAGITLLPDFAVASLIRDIAGYAVQRPLQRTLAESAIGSAIGAAGGGALYGEEGAIAGGVAGLGLGPMAFAGAEVISAIKNIVMKDDAFRRFVQSGGVTQGLNVRDPKSAREILRMLGDDAQDILSFDSWGDALTAVGSVGNSVLRPFKAIGETAEMAPRLAAFKKAKDMGLSDAEAALFAQDVTLRFASKGSATRGIASVTPFFNAKLQGWNKLGRLIADPKTSALGVATITAPTLALWAVNKDNPEYWERPLWEKNLFWLIPKSIIPGGEDTGFFRVPKPFEIGYIFASLPERMLDYAARSGDEGVMVPDFVEKLIGETAAPRSGEPGRELASTAADFYRSTFGEAFPIPTVLEVPLQQWANRSFFTGREIVPEYMEQREPEFQYRGSTPGAARLLAGAVPEAIEKIPGLEWTRSPLRMEQAITDFLGTFGRRGMSALDVALREAGLPASAERPGEVLPELTGISRFTAREYDVTESERQAQDKIRRLESTYSALRQLQNEGASSEEIQSFIQKNRSELIARNELSDFKSELDRLNRRRNDIERNRSIPEQDRKRMLDAIKERANAIASRVVEYRIK